MASSFPQIMKALYVAFHAVGTARRVRLSPSLYFRIPKLKVQLWSVMVGNSQTMELSIPDTKTLFQSIRTAYELQELREIKIDDLSWTTDCRQRPEAPERVSIAFKGPLGSGYTSLERKDIARALEEFENGLIAAL